MFLLYYKDQPFQVAHFILDSFSCWIGSKGRDEMHTYQPADEICFIWVVWRGIATGEQCSEAVRACRFADARVRSYEVIIRIWRFSRYAAQFGAKCAVQSARQRGAKTGAKVYSSEREARRREPSVQHKLACVTVYVPQGPTNSPAIDGTPWELLSMSIFYVIVPVPSLTS